MFKKALAVGDMADTDLVISSLGGDRNAFCEIVTRYQTLLCSLAYSSVGDIRHSEDIAQETFVEAWRKLDTLNDPAKLKSWLCGILRFKISRFFRKQANQPAVNATDIEVITNSLADQAKLEDTAIDDQHQQLLWNTLESMPENYREPLVLFYREQKSVESVANELELSVDVVKQRLSRGRKQLQKTMIKLVETGLEKTKPGAGFTLAVMTSVATISPPSKASGLSVAAANTSWFFKLTSVLAVLASVSGLISSYFGLQAGLAQSRTERERQSTIKFVSRFLGSVILFVAVLFSLRQLALSLQNNLMSLSLIAHLSVILFVIYYCWLLVRLLKDMRNLRYQEQIFNPEAFDDPQAESSKNKREYKSRVTIAGIPLFHFRFDVPERNEGAVIGWVAGGDRAYGLLFAWGAFAIAPISVGIVSVGIISVGAIGLGLFGIGAVGIGLLAFGSSAIGYSAFAGLSALGWQVAASNGFALAKEGAVGAIAIAEHVNNDVAAELASLSLVEQLMPWLNSFIAIMVIMPAAWYANRVRKRLGNKQ
ncbi:MAG: sigma-70 family RNA polymerase sigma factor [Kangiellaceae bacterium]|jgi:RNA polymerase sigma factor (sigma-70 family)|nr:sigma-70 family RNA polymerase sigma factor [Kangiellaceae bacterium]